MEGFCCATGLGKEGGGPAGCAFPLSVDSHLAAAGGGLRLHHSPPSLPEGDLASGIPHSAAAGALATTGKKLTERHLAPCVFFVPIPSLTKASF